VVIEIIFKGLLSCYGIVLIISVFQHFLCQQTLLIDILIGGNID